MNGGELPSSAIDNKSEHGGLEVVTNPAVIAYLNIGQPNTSHDKIGPGYHFRSEADIVDAMRAVSEATRPLTVRDAAFCIDERYLIQLGDIKDPEFLANVVAWRLQGGTYWAATRGALAANAVIVRGAKNYFEAYDRVAGVLAGAGFQDAGHEGCGARNNGKTSVENQVDADTSFGISLAAGIAREGERGIVSFLHNNKRRLLEKGMYDADPKEHEERIRRTAPQYYAKLKAGRDPVHGHHGRGLYIVEGEQGLAKCEVPLFAYTSAFARLLAECLGGTPEERRAIELAVADDLIDVGNVLFAKPEGDYPGMAVIKQAASTVGA